MEKTVKLGPDGFDKIAIVGSATSSTLLTPFDDPTWAIWCCSPAVFAQVASRRSDAWFELHRWLPYQPGKSGAPGTRPWFSPEYHQFLKGHKGPVYMTEQQADIPQCVRYPYKEMLAKHGPYHFSSTVAWMLAWAIEQQPKVIGLFGVDMAAGEEWAYQRPGCQHFVGMAAAMGIQIVLPPESDLMRHTTLYGIGEHNHRHVKLRERLVELEAKQAELANAVNQNTMMHHQVTGQVVMLKHILELWSDDLDPSLETAMSYAGQHVKRAAEAADGSTASTGAQVREFKAS